MDELKRYGKINCTDDEQNIYGSIMAENKKGEWIKYKDLPPQLPDPCTVEQYKQITGEKFPKTALIWRKNKTSGKWESTDYMNCDLFGNSFHSYRVIVQTGKKYPNADWKPEVKS